MPLQESSFDVSGPAPGPYDKGAQLTRGDLDDALRSHDPPASVFAAPGPTRVTISAEQREYILAKPAARSNREAPSRPSSADDGLVNEARRLTIQHYAYKRACEDLILLPHAADKLRASAHRPLRIMDVGTGTGVWLDDLQASGIVTPSDQLHGADLDLGLSRLAKDNVDRGRMPARPVIQHNVLDAFGEGSGPEQVGQTGSYDVVHARLLVFALQKHTGWAQAVENMAGLLKSGGILQLADLNAAGYSPAQSQAGKPTAVQALNPLTAKALEFLGKDQFAGDHLEGHLKAAGLVNVTTRRFQIPCGKCAIQRGWSAQQAADASASATGAIAALKVPFLAAGGDPHLAHPRGHGITTEADFDAWHAELVRETEREGMFLNFTMACGEKAS